MVLVWRVELDLVGSLVVGVPITLLAGLLFGATMGLFMRWRAARFRRRFELPSSWEDYHEPNKRANKPRVQVSLEA